MNRLLSPSLRTITRRRSVRYFTDDIAPNRTTTDYNSIITKLGSGRSGPSTDPSVFRYMVKDNIATTRGKTTAASKALSTYNSPFNSTVVDLLDSQEYKLIGKTNLDEFGMGSASMNSFYALVMNPSNSSTVAGGSSGGSAAAVYADYCEFALGTDTGGSVRLPAAYCQVAGFKPTYGRISRWGVIPYAQTLDTVGILTKDLELMKKVYRALDKFDDKDPTSLPEEVRNKIVKTTSRERLVIGVPEEFILSELSDSAREALQGALVRLQDLGHEVRRVSIKSIKKALPAYYTLATAEAASNLARYDGLRYGHNTDIEVESGASELLFKNRSSNFSEEVGQRIILGNYTLSSDSGDHYLRATELREELCREFSSAFKNPHVLLQDQQNDSGVDLIMGTTALSSAPSMREYLEQTEKNMINEYANDVLTVPASLAGIPAASVQFKGIGIQLMGQFGDDELVLDVAKELSK